MAQHTLGVIGGGNMGEAILRGALEQQVLPADRIIVAEVDATRRSLLAGMGLPVTDDPGAALDCEQLMLAVKPQSFPAVAEVIGPLATPTVVISIMAGLQSARLRQRLGEHARVVRVMPNTPCQIGMGMSSIALGEGATDADAELSRRLFGSIGAVAVVEEDLMNAVTAVAGSGPAYVFRLAEAMEAGAIAVGVDPPVARQLVLETIRGAGALLVESDQTPAALRDAVTSKGGTTAAGLAVMNERGVEEMMVRAIEAARDRGIELDQ